MQKIPQAVSEKKAAEFGDNTAIVVFGASGDLAKKKTFPALFGLYREGYLSSKVKIIGYARSKLDDKQFKDRILGFFKTKNKNDEAKAQEFLDMCSYISAPYDKPEGYEKLNETINEYEKENNVKESHRLFYLALPPSVFIPVATEVRKYVHPGSKGVARIIVEKPFGHDLQSAEELLDALKPIWKEEEMFRIDHYLGKEMVKNLLAFRFGNQFINASWNKRYIKCIQISFKEPFGTEGRGGYFDSIGIIRDVIQNHLLQVLTLLTMERPVSNDPEAVRDEKVRILKSIAELDLKDVLVGQYGKSKDGTKPAYVDDETVEPGSKCVTFAAIGLQITTERWEGVPIILRAGKALNEGKVEIRVQYKQSSGFLNDIQRNELVIRIQPNEAMYMKLNSKVPGVSQKTTVTELDLTYKDRYENFYIPEAYESLIRDAMKGDHSNFVRDDELLQSWKIFTPLLNHLEGPDAPAPEIYPYGSRGPASLTKFMQDHDYFFESRSNYQWPVTRPDVLGKM